MGESNHIATQNFQKMEELCDELIDGGIGVELAAVIGKAGRGKTYSAERIFSKTSTTTYLHCGIKWSVAKLLREIAFVLNGTRPRFRDICEQIIKDEMAAQRRILLVDDAHRLNINCLNVLRDIHDLTGAPILMIGEEHLKGKIYRENGLKSRVRKILYFEPISQADIVVYYSKQHKERLQPDQSLKLLRSAAGDFRYIILSAVFLRRIQKSSGINTITDSVMSEVCKEIEKARAEGKE